MPAVSQAQQRFMGMVHAEKEGKLDKSKLDPEFAAKIERIAARIKAKAARDYAETKHKNLPKKKKSKKSASPPEGDSRGQNKKAEYIMYKLAKEDKKSYPQELKQSPSPHLFWKALMPRIGFTNWGDDAIKTKGVGAAVERVLPFGNSGRHWPLENPEKEIVKKKPGAKGVLQRIIPGGDTGYQIEKKGAVNKQLAKLTQETFKYYKYVKKESTKMARIKAANARDNSSWPKYVLDKMEKTFKSKKAPVKKVVQAPNSKGGQQMELFSKKANDVFTKIAGSDLWFISADHKEQISVPTRYHYTSQGKYSSPVLHFTKEDMKTVSSKGPKGKLRNSYFVKPENARAHEAAYASAKDRAVKDIFIKKKGKKKVKKKILGITYKTVKKDNYVTDWAAVFTARKHPDYKKGSKKVKAFMKKHRNKGYYVDVG